MHEQCGKLRVPCYDRVINPEEACVLADRAVVATFTFAGGLRTFSYTLRSRKMVPLGGDGSTARLEFDPTVTDGVPQVGATRKRQLLLLLLLRAGVCVCVCARARVCVRPCSTTLCMRTHT